MKKTLLFVVIVISDVYIRHAEITTGNFYLMSY